MITITLPDNAAMRALERLTPGGSEYVGDVPNCVAAIKRFQDMQHRGMLMWAKRARKAEAKLKVIGDWRLGKALEKFPLLRAMATTKEQNDLLDRYQGWFLMVKEIIEDVTPLASDEDVDSAIRVVAT